MVESSAAKRRALSQRVFHDIATSRRELRVVAEDGSCPIVVALETELLSVVLERVMKAGGAANTFVEMKGEVVELLAIHVGARRWKKQRSPRDLGPTPIHDDIEIGMMVDVARGYEDGVVVPVRLSSNVLGEVEHVEDGDLISA